VDKKKRSEFSEDGDVGEALNMSVSENIQHILERLGKLDTLETLLTKSLAKLEKLETRVNDVDLKVETLEVKCRGHDKSLGELKQVRNSLTNNSNKTRSYSMLKP